MAGLGSLTIDLAANITRFENSLNRAERLAQKRADGISRTFSRLAGGLGAVLSGAGLIKAVDSALDFADAIGKAADRAGVATGALQELRYVGDQFGITTQQMDDGLRRFTRRLGVAFEGGSFKKSFDDLGVSIRDANGAMRSSDAVLDDVIKKLGALENQALKSQYAAQVFGDDAGPQLAVALGAGAQKVEELRMKARNLGLVMREDVIRNAEKTNDELSTLGQVLKVELSSALISIAPQIQSFASSLIEITQNVAGFFASTENLSKDQVVRRITNITEAIEEQRSKLVERQAIAEGTGATDFFLDMILPSPESMQNRITTLESELQAAWERLGNLNLQTLTRSNQVEAPPLGVLGLTDDQLLNEIVTVERHLQQINELERQSAEERKRIEKQVSDTILNMKMAVFQQAASLIRAIAPESKKAAIAALVIEKGLAIAKIKIDTLAAAMNARKYGDPLTAEANAKRIEALGALSIGLVAATGLAQAANINSGGPGSAGTGTTLGTQTPSEAALSPFAQGQSGSITINVNGVVTDEIVHDLIVPAIQDAVANRDIILINGDSRNAQEFIA